MLAVNPLEEAGGGTGSIWIPIVILGWFLVMTVVGWRVSQRSARLEEAAQEKHPARPEDNPSEFDRL